MNKYRKTYDLISEKSSFRAEYDVYFICIYLNELNFNGDKLFGILKYPFNRKRRDGTI